MDLGTHSLFIGQLVASESLSDDKSATYDYYQNNVKPKPENIAKKGWRCKICGYIYEGEELPDDYICPICKRGFSTYSCKRLRNYLPLFLRLYIHQSVSIHNRFATAQKSLPEYSLQIPSR